MPRDPYEVLGVAARRRRDPDQEGLPQARARAAPRRQRARPSGRGEVQGGRGGLRDPLRRRSSRDVRPLRPRRPALRWLRAELRRVRLDHRPVRRLLRRRQPVRRALGPRARRRRRRARRDRPARRGAGDVGGGLLRGDRSLRGVPRQRRRARHADRDVQPLRRRGPAAGRVAHALRPDGAHDRVRPCHGDGRIATRALRHVPRTRTPGRAPDARGRRPGRDLRRAADPPRPAAATSARPARPPATCTCSCACARTSASCARAIDLITALDVAGADGRARRRARRPHPRGHRHGRGSRRHAARRDPDPARPGHARPAPWAPRRHQGRRQRRHPAPPHRHTSASCSRSSATR